VKCAIELKEAIFAVLKVHRPRLSGYLVAIVARLEGLALVINDPDF
jgi:hypothetical protein